jgi:hypothetical protein
VDVGLYHLQVRRLESLRDLMYSTRHPRRVVRSHDDDVVPLRDVCSEIAGSCWDVEYRAAPRRCDGPPPLLENEFVEAAAEEAEAAVYDDRLIQLSGGSRIKPAD